MFGTSDRHRGYIRPCCRPALRFRTAAATAAGVLPVPWRAAALYGLDGAPYGHICERRPGVLAG